MDPATIAVLHECTERSLAGTISFPEVVGKLMARGVESYHADLYRQEKTYYLPDGESHIEGMAADAPTPVAREFCEAAVVQAVRDIQQGKLNYVEFLDRIRAAGATQYHVYLTGKCAVYIGRDGSQYVERFPGKA